MINRHGADAATQAQVRVIELLHIGEPGAAKIWQQVATAIIEVLQFQRT